MTRTPLFVSLLAAALAAALPLSAPAQPARAAAAPAAATPSQLVLANSTRIIATLERRRDEFSRDRAALNRFIATEFEQMFDRDYAARMVLGRHGRGAAEADVALFADALADSLMARYGSALLGLDSGLKVRVKAETPLRGGAIVKVASEYLRRGGEPVPVDYLMRRSGSGWKVFDVIVEGVSFVQTFRTQFDAPLSRKSIAEVAADLRAGRLQADPNRQ
ncbi:MlaC/ttg2D family ABC transporter substrate-binding protein [Vulcaniibacterium gelatinicum]|uniref:MlaC/ttg2D family ABC transporter substrate-binding protein n=1 Tax=Vulcaniibacterium gelatinicum TaxID=2598725 RepID=UPI0011C8720D|nr:ABC transporter substrate-binding protein [Vulcaniibacterium gelatinicum]